MTESSFPTKKNGGNLVQFFCKGQPEVETTHQELAWMIKSFNDS